MRLIEWVAEKQRELFHTRQTLEAADRRIESVHAHVSRTEEKADESLRKLRHDQWFPPDLAPYFEEQRKRRERR